MGFGALHKWSSMVILLWGGMATADSLAAQALPAAASAPVYTQAWSATTAVAVAKKPALVHPFWDRKNVLLFSGIAVFRGMDYASTHNFQARGRTEILLAEDVVNNSAAFASVEAAGAVTSVGISYLFHRTGHHKMERWLSIGHIAVTGFGVGWNYSLKSKHAP